MASATVVPTYGIDLVGSGKEYLAPKQGAQEIGQRAGGRRVEQPREQVHPLSRPAQGASEPMLIPQTGVCGQPSVPKVGETSSKNSPESWCSSNGAVLNDACCGCAGEDVGLSPGKAQAIYWDDSSPTEGTQIAPNSMT
jgi:hypothetical protein